MGFSCYFLSHTEIKQKTGPEKANPEIQLKGRSLFCLLPGTISLTRETSDLMVPVSLCPIQAMTAQPSNATLTNPNSQGTEAFLSF